MKIKVFYPNQQGKLEFTKKELEELLNEAYHEGYQDGDRKHWYGYTYCNSVTALSNAVDCTTQASCDLAYTDTTTTASDITGVYAVNVVSALDDSRLEGECNCANLS